MPSPRFGTKKQLLVELLALEVINLRYLIISRCSIAPQCEKKSRTSFSVALGDKVVTSTVNPPGYIGYFQ